MKYLRQHWQEALFLLILSAVWFAIGWVIRDYSLTANQDVALFAQARQELLDNFALEMPPSNELTYAAVRSMVEQLNDPYAAFLEPVVASRFQADYTGESGVVGLFPEKINGEFVVSIVLPGGGAEKVGVQEGDVLLSIDGVDLDETKTEGDAALLLRGPVGSAAQLVVRRSDEVLEFAPVRAVRSVTTKLQMLDGDVAYFAHHTFTSNAPDEVGVALDNLLAQNPKAIIWDMRSNGGGSMEAAESILSYFIEDGLLFTAELKGGQVREFVSNGDGRAADIPLVVLVGEHTFSAAETSAASIQDRERGTLIGETTFGKGTIQNTAPLVGGSALQYTIAKWLSPNGAWYDGIGVSPDIEVTDDPATPEDEVLQAALEYLRGEIGD